MKESGTPHPLIGGPHKENSWRILIVIGTGLLIDLVILIQTPPTV